MEFCSSKKDEASPGTSSSPPPPDRTAVKLTLGLSASCQRLDVCVESGHDWVRNGLIGSLRHFT